MFIRHGMEFKFFYLQVWESQLGIRIGEGIREKTWHKAIIATEKYIEVSSVLNRPV